MAQHFFGLNRGGELFDKSISFQTGAATTGTDMEFRYDDTKGLTYKDVHRFLTRLVEFIKQSTVEAFKSM